MVEKETIVNDLPDNVVDTAELCKVFGVTRQAIYKWRKMDFLRLFGRKMVL